MQESTTSVGGSWQPDAPRDDENDITMPIRTICSQAGEQRDPRAHLLEEKGEPVPLQTPDFTEIGEPAV